jgi:hypothetical protein
VPSHADWLSCAGLAMAVEPAAEQHPGQQHGEHHEADQTQPALGGGTHHDVGVARAEEAERQDEAGQHEEQRDRGGSVDRCEADAAEHCGGLVEAVHDAELCRIEGPQEMPGDDDERCQAAQCLELHEPAVRAHGDGRQACADRLIGICNVQRASASASLGTGANKAMNLTSM